MLVRYGTLDLHTRTIVRTESVPFRNIYVCTDMLEITTNEKRGWP